MTFLDLFAGIGGFRRGLERSGHTCVGHVEIDKYANQSYMAMFELDYCPYGKKTTTNSRSMCKAEVSRNCDGKECKGEWYAKDIKQITAGEIPRAEIWTFGFPCVDVSVCGRMAGIHGERSGLFFNVISLLKSLPAEDKPQWTVAENVKHLVHSEKGTAFTTVLFELWEAGYDCEWQVANSKDFQTPQFRERVYIVGHLRAGGRCAGKILPVGGTNPAAVKGFIGKGQGNRVYHLDGLSITLTANGGGMGGRTGLYPVPVNQNCNVQNLRDAADLLAMGGKKGTANAQKLSAAIPERPMCAAFIDMNEHSRLTQFAKCVKVKQNAGVVNHKGETTGVFLCQERPDCVRAVTNPQRAKPRQQNGRRLKESGEPAFTLTCQDRAGIMLCCCGQRKAGDAGDADAPYVCCRIRRLTPKECWRLQSFEDELFDRARAAGISDTQLYKQAGNAITVNIAYEIGLQLRKTAYKSGSVVTAAEISDSDF